MNEEYRKSGVDVEAGYEAVRRLKSHAHSTYDSNVIGGIGGFAGLYNIGNMNLKEPVLVSGADGVGTKLKLAFLMNKHDTIGIDCVAMCVNDILCVGAKPLFFLDYIANDKINPIVIEQIVAGVAEGCRQCGAALLGGETAEMPGFYLPKEYDIAGFSVGIVDRSKMISSENVKVGDALIGLASSGQHSNGFSLTRKIFDMDNHPENLQRYFDELGCKLGEALLMPTKIYVKPVIDLMSTYEINGICHITGGGFVENVPRMLPPNMTARIEKAKLRPQPIFSVMQKLGNIREENMYSTFNMGVGMVLAVSSDIADSVVKTLCSSGTDAYIIGEVVQGDEGVIVC